MSKGMTIAIVAVCVLAAVIIAGIVAVGTGMLTINMDSGNQGVTSVPTSASVAKPITSPKEQSTEPKEGSDKITGTWYGEEKMSFGPFGIVKTTGKFTAVCNDDGTGEFICYIYGLEDYGVSSDLPYSMVLKWEYKSGTSFEAFAEDCDPIPFTCDGKMMYMEINPVKLKLVDNDMAKAFADQDIPIHLYKQ